MKKFATLLLAGVLSLAMMLGLCACDSDHVHVYSQDVITEATCKSGGKVRLVCQQCGDTRMIDMPVVPHSFTVWEVETEVSCTGEGLWTRHCTMCGLEQTGVIPARGHQWGEWKIEEATCETKGMMSRSCNNCSEKEVEVIEALGHVFSSTFTIDKHPTKTEDGMRSRHCMREGCNARTDEEVIPKLAGN